MACWTVNIEKNLCAKHLLAMKAVIFIDSSNTNHVYQIHFQSAIYFNSLFCYIKIEATMAVF